MKQLLGLGAAAALGPACRVPRHAPPATAGAAARALPFGEIDALAEQSLVPMRDGVRLATDLYLPPRPQRRPAALIRLPYDKTSSFAFMPSIARHLAGQGYAVVVQDVRGKIRSEGEPLAFVHEVADGHDTLEWIARQPWSNGAVGMLGDSYYGFTQWAAAAAGHPALRCIAPRMTGTAIDSGWMYSQGVFCLYTMLWWASLTWMDRRLWEGGLDWRRRPLDAILPAAHGGRRSPSFDRWMRTPPGDPYWTEAVYAGLGNPRDRIDIPVLHAGGWWDVFQAGQMSDYRTMSRRAAAQHLEMGSRDHWDQELREDGVPAPDLHDESSMQGWIPRYLEPTVRFFARHLRGDAGVVVPAVRWHLANEGWKESPAWPPPGSRPLTLHLAGAARAGSGPEGGVLAAAPDGATTVARFTHDPENPVPYLTEDAWACLADLPDERAIESRPDVLTFTGEAAGEALDLAGPVSARLRLSSSAGSMHVIARLIDVYPSGRARRILEGAALHAAARDEAVVTIALGDTGYRLRPGHRLRLEIASSLFPRFLLHPGTDEDPWTAMRHAANEQRLRTGGSAGSLLTLTVLDRTRA